MGLRGFLGDRDGHSANETVADERGCYGPPLMAGAGRADDHGETIPAAARDLDILAAELDSLADRLSAAGYESSELRGSIEGLQDQVRNLLDGDEEVTEAGELVTDGGEDFMTPDESSESAEPADGNRPGVDADADSNPRVQDPPSDGSSEKRTDDQAEPSLSQLFAEVGAPVGSMGNRSTGDGGDREGDATQEASSTGDMQSDGGHGDRPYLRGVPDGFGNELLVMEWLSFLVAESSVDQAMRAIRYYEEVDWIAPDAASYLRTMVGGLEREQTPAREDSPPSDLTVEHHTQSLEYISRLSGLDERQRLNP